MSEYKKPKKLLLDEPPKRKGASAKSELICGSKPNRNVPSCDNRPKPNGGTLLKG